MTKLHAKLPLALRTRPQQAREAEHGVETAVRVNGEILGPDFRVVDDGVAFVEEADNGALELVGGRDGRFHQGFENLRRACREGFAEGLLRGVLEGHFGTVGHVSRAVKDLHVSP